MVITETGNYKLLRDFKTSNSASIGTLPAGSIIKITQIDTMYNKVIGPDLRDWTYHVMPVIKV